jgi:hypothetical protein
LGSKMLVWLKERVVPTPPHTIKVMKIEDRVLLLVKVKLDIQVRSEVPRTAVTGRTTPFRQDLSGGFMRVYNDHLHSRNRCINETAYYQFQYLINLQNTETIP